MSRRFRRVAKMRLLTGNEILPEKSTRNFTLVLDEFQNLKIAGEGIFSDIQDVREKINAGYETYSGFMLEKCFRQSYSETGEYNIVTNYWKKRTGGAPGEYQEIDLIAVNETDHSIVIGECKRNPNKIRMNVLLPSLSNISNPHSTFFCRT